MLNSDSPAKLGQNRGVREKIPQFCSFLNLLTIHTVGSDWWIGPFILFF